MNPWLIDINGTYPDNNFDIKLSASDFNAAEDGHGHPISGVYRLLQEVASKSDASHSHNEFIRSIMLSDDVASSDIVLSTDNLYIIQQGQQISVSLGTLSAPSTIKGLVNANISADDLGVFIQETTDTTTLLEDFTTLIIDDNGVSHASNI